MPPPRPPFPPTLLPSTPLWSNSSARSPPSLRLSGRLPKRHGARSPGCRDKHGRKPIPASVPRETTRQTPEQCSACGGSRLNKKKVLVSEEWDYARAHLRVRRTERDLCECQDCFEAVVPEQPPMPFERAACTFEMMAWLCFAKVGLFLPLDRVQRDFEDQGARISSATLTRWWQAGADLLLPVAKAVRLSLLAGAYIRTDGTGLTVVFPRKKGKPVKGPARDGPTLVGTCRLLGVDPYSYLQWALSRIVPHPDNRGLVAADLVPAAYKTAQQAGAQ